MFYFLNKKISLYEILKECPGAVPPRGSVCKTLTIIIEMKKMEIMENGD
jgi:hypothetical protein